MVLALGSLPARAYAPSFTITATSVTMPSTGDGSMPFTLSSVNGYVGHVGVQCTGVDAPMGAKVPYCGGGPVIAYSLGANEVLQQTLVLTPYGVPVPLATGTLLMVFAVRRRKSRALIGMAAGMVASLGLIAGCGSGNSGMTAGTYAYTIVATDTKTNIVVTTSANVTVR
jgi:hypothetical protein